MKRWIALDLETTGLSPTRHEIRQLAMVPFGIDADRTEHALRFVAADFHPCPPPATRSRLVDLLRMIGGDSVLVAHNAAFDLAFLAETLRRLRVTPFDLRAYCTLRLSKALLPHLARYDLGALQVELGLASGERHVALADGRTAAELFKALVQRAAFADEETIRKLHGPPVRVGVGRAS